MESLKIDDKRLLEAVDEYFTTFGFSISGDQRLNEGPISGRIPLVSARYVGAEMSEREASLELEIRMESANHRGFTIHVPYDYLTPARDPASDTNYDLEHLIAEHLVFLVDETIAYHTAEELDGSKLSNFWR
jgi:hypothetical protein